MGFLDTLLPGMAAKRAEARLRKKKLDLQIDILERRFEGAAKGVGTMAGEAAAPTRTRRSARPWHACATERATFAGTTPMPSGPSPASPTT